MSPGRNALPRWGQTSDILLSPSHERWSGGPPAFHRVQRKSYPFPRARRSSPIEHRPPSRGSVPCAVRIVRTTLQRRSKAVAIVRVVRWFRGFVVSWFRGFVVSWFRGFVVSWFRGFDGTRPVIQGHDKAAIVRPAHFVRRGKVCGPPQPWTETETETETETACQSRYRPKVETENRCSGAALHAFCVCISPFATTSVRYASITPRPPRRTLPEKVAAILRPTETLCLSMARWVLSPDIVICSGARRLHEKFGQQGEAIIRKPPCPCGGDPFASPENAGLRKRRQFDRCRPYPLRHPADPYQLGKLLQKIHVRWG